MKMKRIRIKRTGGMVAEPPASGAASGLLSSGGRIEGGRTARLTLPDINPENLRMALFGNEVPAPRRAGTTPIPEDYTDSLAVLRAEHALEQAHEWNRWANEIPTIQFPSHWQIKMVPPFAGAIVRFVVYLEGREEGVSVYLDCYQRLGYFGNVPYWELYPYAGDTYRLPMADTVELVQRIEHSLTGNYPPEYQDGSEDTDTPE